MDVELVERTISSPVDADGAVEGVGAETARLERCRCRLHGQSAEGDVSNLLLSVAGQVDEPLKSRRDDLGFGHVLIGKRPVDNLAARAVQGTIGRAGSCPRGC